MSKNAVVVRFVGKRVFIYFRATELVYIAVLPGPSNIKANLETEF